VSHGPSTLAAVPDPAALARLLGRDLVIGVASAAWQTEGSVTADGRGSSIWDDFASRPGAVDDGSTGEPATDSYRRWRDDVDLLAGLGVDAYRFSVAWPRIQPTGTGPAVAAGLDHYERLVDALLAGGIDPMVTLYHWDLPSALEAAGGWMVRDTAARLADYAGIVASRLGDRVRWWATLNEGFSFTSFGYALGVHAPGRTLLQAAFPAVHHALLGHGLAVQAVRAAAPGARCLLVNNLAPVTPVSQDPADVAAARLLDGRQNRTWNDPVLLGRYPQDLHSLYSPEADDVVVEGDLEVIAQPLDALGVNYYFPHRAGAPAMETNPLGFDLAAFDDVATTAFDWPVVPAGLTDLLVGLRDQYGSALPPVLITENGSSWHDVVEPGPDGPAIHDVERISYLDAHLRAVVAARAAGVDVRGYFHWTLLDNVEWAEGFGQRFGLVRHDRDTGERVPKDSYAWLRTVVGAR
jgi:beta-glucosidase